MAGPVEAKGMKLISQNTLDGQGGVGEGMAMQRTKDGRRILWLAHEGPPTNFTAVDVTDPKNTKVIGRQNLPHNKVRSNSLEIVGDVMAVAYQTYELGVSPAGVELFDISVPENPRSISFFDCSGPHSRGVHQVWFADGEYIHFSGGGEGIVPRNPLDDQIYRILDVRNPTKPTEVGRWWPNGILEGDSAPPPERAPMNAGHRAHNTNVYPQRPDRAYVGFIDSGAFILDISDKSSPKVISAWNPHPPFPGFTHTVMPLFSRDLLVVADECVQDLGKDWPKLIWMVDARREDKLVPIGTFPMPSFDVYGRKGGRFGAHNLHENHPSELSFKSETLIFGTFFNAGVRVFDTSNPLQVQEVAAYVPEAPEGSRTGTIQINDVYVDDRGLVFAADRHAGGIYVIEMDV